MADVVVIIPVLQRPHRASQVIESLTKATPPGVARPLFVATPGDDAEILACRATGADVAILPVRHNPGDYARKINYAWRRTTEPWMLLGADDIDFRPGWFDAAMRVAATGAKVIGTNDLGNARVMRGEHGTHCLVERAYVDEHGTIDGVGVMHEGYVHEYSDDELVGTAKYRGVWGFAGDSIIEHLHPAWLHPDGRRKAPTDHLYDDQQNRMRQSRALFRARRPMWNGGSPC